MDRLVKKQESVLGQAMDGDPDDAFTNALRGRYNDLEAQRADLAPKLAAVDESAGAQPDKQSPDAVALLDALPYLAVNLAKVPEDLLRTLFEAVQLSIQVHDEGEHATMTITLPADQVSKVAGAAERIGDQMNPQGTPEGRARGVLDRAPVRFRQLSRQSSCPRGCCFGPTCNS
jgi:site-specific DNA recombinase